MTRPVPRTPYGADDDTRPLSELCAPLSAHVQPKGLLQLRHPESLTPNEVESMLRRMARLGRRTCTHG